MGLRNQWTAIGISLVLLGIIVILATANFPFIPGVVGSLGVVLITSGTIEIGITQMTSREITETVESSVTKNLNKPLSAFYQDRSDRVDVRHRAENAEALWFAWISGSRVTIQAIAEAADSDADLRLVLVHPESRILKEINKATESSISLDGLKEDIRATTRAASKSGFEVRWLEEPQINSFNIINPEHEGAVAELDVFLPFRSPEDRPTIVVSPKSGEELFDRLKDTFENRVWRNAEPPKDD